MWQLMPWEEYKRLAVEEGRQNGMLPTARRLGIGKTTLYRWMEQQVVKEVQTLVAGTRTAQA